MARLSDGSIIVVHCVLYLDKYITRGGTRHSTPDAIPTVVRSIVDQQAHRQTGSPAAGQEAAIYQVTYLSTWVLCCWGLTTCLVIHYRYCVQGRQVIESAYARATSLLLAHPNIRYHTMDIRTR